MGTTADKLNKVLQTKEAIRTAINNKGGTLTETDTFSSYATAIDNIQNGSSNEPITITQNGTYTAPEGIGYSPVNVNVPSKEEETKSITITENGTTTVLPTSGKVLSKVDIVANVQSGGESLTIKDLLERSTSMDFLFCMRIAGSNTTVYRDNLMAFINNELLSKFITSPDDVSKATSMRETFHGAYNLTYIPVLNTSKVTDMYGIFWDDEYLLEIKGIDTSNVKDLTYAFRDCYKLTSIPHLDTHNCKKFQYTFQDCREIEYIQPLNTDSISEAPNGMFYDCWKLKRIDITKYYKDNYEFAASCYSLKEVIIRTMDTIPEISSSAFNKCYHFYGTTNATYNPEGLKDGIIYVPDDKVEALKTATNWSVFADNILPLSLLEKPYIFNINSKSNNYMTNRNSSFFITLLYFINTPEVIITSSNEQVATISDIVITTKRITFKANYLSVGVATITVQITGDTSATKTIDIDVIEGMQYRVEQISEATYGFTLNSNEYYESTNKGKPSSYSLCKLVFNITEKFKTLKLECISSGESNYDFGILSNIDTTLSLNNSEDSSTKVYKSFKGQSSTTPVVITYPEATVGEHFIYIKYRKDGSGDNDNDSLQFKVIS